MPDVAPHNMTSDSAPSPYVASASSQYAEFGPYRAFDGAVSLGHYWLTGSTQSGWLKIDMGSGNTYKLSYYQLQMNTIPETARAPKDWTLQGSNNDSDWDILDTVTDQTGWGSGELREFLCDVTSTAYRYFKVVVTANNGDSYLQIAELYLFSEWPFKFSGIITLLGAPVVRSVFAYLRSTGELYSSTTSEADGSFSMNAPDLTTELFVIALPGEGDNSYNALVYDRVTGYEI